MSAGRSMPRMPAPEAGATALAGIPSPPGAAGAAGLGPALEELTDGVWELDVKAGAIRCRGAWCRARSRAADAVPAEGVSLPWQALVHPDDAEAVRAAMVAYLDGSSSGFRTELRVSVRDGGWRWVVSRGIVTERDADGRPRRVLGTVMDISASKELAQRLEAAERRHRALLESVPDLILLVRRNGVVVDYHANSADLLVVPPEQFLNRSLLDVLPAELAQQSLELVATALAENRTVTHEYSLDRRGQIRHYEARIAPCEPDMVACIVRDVTDRVQARQAIRSVEQRLHQAEKLQAIGQLASGIAHDFNNQMNSIIFLGDLLRQGATDPDRVRRYADMMVRRATSSSELTQRLLGLARGRNAEPAPVDLHALVHEVIALLHTTLDKNIRIGTRLRATDVRISADRSQVENALLNLAINARDAMPQGGELLFLTDTVDRGPGHCRFLETEILPGRYARVTVQDSGCGMDEATLERIFEPLFSTKPSEAGCGLGLAAVADTVKTLKGWVEVDSAPGRGTRFALGFPVEASAATSAAAGTGHLAAGRHIMVVDDEDLFREIMGDHLRRLGSSVTLCAGGSEALEELSRRGMEVELVILDLVMPRVDGLQVLRRLQEMASSVRVLLVSGNPLPAPLTEATATGNCAFLRKPFTPEALAAAVAALLARPR